MILPSFHIGVSDPRGTIGLIDLDRVLDFDDECINDRMRLRIAAARKAMLRLRGGWRPGPKTLEHAPRLHDWTFYEFAPYRVVLHGTVVGHPRLGDRPMIQTSFLIGIDATHLKWARTLSRFYVLGEPEKQHGGWE